MSARCQLLVALLAVSAAGRGEAAFVVGVSSQGPSTSTQPPSQTDGTLSFNLNTNGTGPSGVNAGSSPTGVPLTTYGSLSSSTNPNGSGGFVNASINYALVVTLGDTEAGALGTIDIGGSGNGGFSTDPSQDNSPFINDSVSRLLVNGVNLSGSLNSFPFDPADSFATFAFRRADGSFLNVRLFDPNPDNDRSNPRPGISFELTLTRGAPLSGFQLITAPPVSAVPVPPSAGLVALGAVSAALPGLRRRLGRLAA